MPFAVAELLLWGPELRRQHRWLFKEMKDLQCQHQAYDARIKTIEATVDNVNSIVSKIHHMEQQILAMQKVDKEKLFEKWVAEEITTLKIFAERNRNIDKKQTELEKDLTTLLDELARMKDLGFNHRGLLRRLDLLDANREQDTDKIRTLEEEIAEFKKVRQSSHARSSQHGLVHGDLVQQPGQVSLFASHEHASDVSSETEVELLIEPARMQSDVAQGNGSPEIQSE